MATTTPLTDEELIHAFSGFAAGRAYRVTMIPLGEENMVSNWETYYLNAASKPEAVKIAREYAKRIVKKQLVYVYLAKKNSWF